MALLQIDCLQIDEVIGLILEITGQKKIKLKYRKRKQNNNYVDNLFRSINVIKTNKDYAKSRS